MCSWSWCRLRSRTRWRCKQANTHTQSSMAELWRVALWQCATPYIGNRGSQVVVNLCSNASFAVARHCFVSQQVSEHAARMVPYQNMLTCSSTLFVANRRLITGTRAKSSITSAAGKHTGKTCETIRRVLCELNFCLACTSPRVMVVNESVTSKCCNAKQHACMHALVRSTQRGSNQLHPIIP